MQLIDQLPPPAERLLCVQLHDDVYRLPVRSPPGPVP
jgi:hypothetical protein